MNSARITLAAMGAAAGIALVARQVVLRRQTKSMGDEDYSAERRRILVQTPRPILWIHRTEEELREPYRYMAVQSIADKCGKDFTICEVTDDLFGDLIPGWTPQVHKMADPVRTHVRALALVRLIGIYGGMLVPSSFFCFHSLRSLYERGTEGNTMFACEALNKNVSASVCTMQANCAFMGAPKGCDDLRLFDEVVQRTISADTTDQVAFSGVLDRWCAAHARVIPGGVVGTRDAAGKPINVERWMSDASLPLSGDALGAWIPGDALRERRRYAWVAEAKEERVRQLRTALGQLVRRSEEK